MNKAKKSIIKVQGTAITVIAQEHGDYISLTDMVRNFEGGGALIEQWLKNKDTVLFLRVWEQITYATEADLLNVALFGHTAKQWRDTNPKLEGNVGDCAGVEQLLVLANMEGMNAEFIHMGLPQGERLNQIAIRQMQVLTYANLKALPGAK